jgi:hypothetical protein
MCTHTKTVNVQNQLSQLAHLHNWKTTDTSIAQVAKFLSEDSCTVLRNFIDLISNSGIFFSLVYWRAYTTDNTAKLSFDCGQGQDICLFSKPSRSTLQPTKPHIQRVQGKAAEARS